MSYLDDVKMVVNARRDELAADLALARQLVDRRASDLSQAQHRVSTLQALLTLVDDVDVRPSGKRKKLHFAMKEVLETQPLRMMRAAALAAEITAEDLYRMQDGRPVDAGQIHARVGNYPNMFVREGTFIKLRDDDLGEG